MDTLLIKSLLLLLLLSFDIRRVFFMVWLYGKFKTLIDIAFEFSVYIATRDLFQMSHSIYVTYNL